MDAQHTGPTLLFMGGNDHAPRRHEPQELTVKAYAKREGVTERTVRNWIDKKAVKSRRTPGVGIRIIVENR
jgi:hypothetical protein